MTNYFDNDFCKSLQPPLVLPRWGDAGYSVYRRSVDAKSICPSPTGEARWGLKLESGSYISRKITLTMIPANHFSPLSFSPEGEMQVTPNCQRLVDTGYSELLKTGWCRLRTGWYMLLLLMCQTFYFIGIFVQFWARCLPTWGKHVAQHGQARCPTWARLLHGCCPFVPNKSDSVWA